MNRLRKERDFYKLLAKTAEQNAKEFASKVLKLAQENEVLRKELESMKGETLKESSPCSITPFRSRLVKSGREM